MKITGSWTTSRVMLHVGIRICIFIIYIYIYIYTHLNFPTPKQQILHLANSFQETHGDLIQGPRLGPVILQPSPPWLAEKKQMALGKKNNIGHWSICNIRFRELPPRKLTWLAGKTIWRCISYKKWWLSILLIVFWTVYSLTVNLTPF